MKSDMQSLDPRSDSRGEMINEKAAFSIRCKLIITARVHYDLGECAGQLCAEALGVPASAVQRIPRLLDSLLSRCFRQTSPPLPGPQARPTRSRPAPPATKDRPPPPRRS